MILSAEDIAANQAAKNTLAWEVLQATTLVATPRMADVMSPIIAIGEQTPVIVPGRNSGGHIVTVSGRPQNARGLRRTSVALYPGPEMDALRTLHNQIIHQIPRRVRTHTGYSLPGAATGGQI